MFDGISRLSAPQPTPPRPAPINTLALLPLLRVQAVEAMVEAIATAAGANAYSTLRWIEDNWGADADLRDHAHPARVAALDPTSPLYKLVEAQEALFGACCDYRTLTGGDGRARARATIEHRYGAAVADYALAPLTARSAAEWDIGTLLADTSRKAPDPTPAQQQAGATTLAHWMLSDHDMDGLADGLEKLLAAVRLAGVGEYTPNVANALTAVMESIAAILAGTSDGERQAMVELVQFTLDTWRTATDGPRITVTLDRPLP